MTARATTRMMLLILAVECLAAVPAAAQHAPRRWVRPADAAARTVRRTPEWQARPPRTGTMVAAGILAGVLGFAGGGALGYRIEREYFPCRCDDPGLLGLLVGAVAGPTLSIPPAVHLAGGRRGSITADLGVSTLIGGIGVAGMLAIPRVEAGVLFLFGAPIAQVIAVTLLERNAALEGG